MKHIHRVSSVIVARTDAHLALEGPSEIGQIVEPDGIGNFLGQCAWMGQAFAGPLDAVLQQVLAEAPAVLLPEDAAELRGAEPAQRGNVVQRDLVEKLRCDVIGRGLRSSLVASAMVDYPGVRGIR